MKTINAPYESNDYPKGDVIAYVYIHQLGRYAHLSGRIESVHDNPLWGKCYKVYIFALQKEIMVKSNNIITEGSLVEINYYGERHSVLIDCIDYDIMYCYDNQGRSEWVKVTSIHSVIETSGLANAVRAQQQLYQDLLVKVGA